MCNSNGGIIIRGVLPVIAGTPFNSWFKQCLVPVNMPIRLQESTICAWTINFQSVGIATNAPMTSVGHRVKIVCSSLRGPTSMDDVHDAVKGNLQCRLNASYRKKIVSYVTRAKYYCIWQMVLESRVCNWQNAHIKKVAYIVYYPQMYTKLFRYYRPSMPDSLSIIMWQEAF